MKSPRRSNDPAPLSEKTQRHLNAYALAATTAGVGALALTCPAEAKTIYTPARRVMSTSNPQRLFPLDLNHDGIADFGFSAYYEIGMSSQFGFLRCAESGKYGNRVWGHGAYDAALKVGTRIGPDGKFDAPDHSMALAYSVRLRSGFQGPWANDGKGVKNRYLGFRFTIKGRTHYGWARLNVKVGKIKGIVNITAILTGYAYETLPNKAIVTGKTKGPDVVTVRPTTLGQLAKGALALPASPVQ
jgi:hypothetical protein